MILIKTFGPKNSPDFSDYFRTYIYLFDVGFLVLRGQLLTEENEVSGLPSYDHQSLKRKSIN